MEQGQYKHVNSLVVERCLNWTKKQFLTMTKDFLIMQSIGR